MKLSIVTINQNNASGLERTLQSIPLGQGLDIESIVIDGVSSDSSLDVVRVFEKAGVRCVSEPDDGVYDAMNKGISMAQGEYINFMNSGDSFLPGVLNQVLPLLKERKIYYGDRLRGVSRILQQWPSEFCLSSAWFKGGLSHQSQFFPRELFQEFGGYDVNEAVISDWKWNLLAALKWNIEFEHLGYAICHYEGGGRSSGTSALHDGAVLRQKEFLKEQFSCLIDDFEELRNFRDRQAERQASGIYKFADRLYRWKNG